MAFDVFVICLIAAGYVLFLVSLLHDAACLLKSTHQPLNYLRARIASMLHAPPPATDSSRKIKQ